MGEKANIVEIIGMTKSASGSNLKKIRTIVILGHKSTGVTSDGQEYSPVNPVQEYSPVNPVTGQKPWGICYGGYVCDCPWQFFDSSCYFANMKNLPAMAAIEVSHDGLDEAFGLRYEGKIDLPKLMNRWNVEEMIKENLKGGFQGELFFGKSSQMESVKVVAQLEKTEQLRREILESPEFKQCLFDQGRQELLTPVCTTARLQAASMDKIRLTIHTPETWSDSYIMNLLDGVSRALLLGNVEVEKAYSGTQGVTISEARADRVSQTITAEVAALKLTGDRIPATCRVEPSYVRTFDNMT